MWTAQTLPCAARNAYGKLRALFPVAKDGQSSAYSCLKWFGRALIFPAQVISNHQRTSAIARRPHKAPPQRDTCPRVNDRIRAPEIRLIGAEGENIGLVTPERGMQLAEQAGLDLVEISPNAAPPVCKIMDFGKFKYEQQKRESALLEFGNHVLDARNRFDLIGMGWLEIQDQRPLGQPAKDREVIHLVARQHRAGVITAIKADR